jgi:biotin operon repressor
MAKAKVVKAASEKKIVRKRIDDDAFVDAWLAAAANNGTQTSVAETLGCTSGGVSIKAKRLREDGVKLPELSGQGRRRAPTDVDGLNDRIKKASKR